MEEPKCEMTSECNEAVTHMDKKGYIYCTTHGLERREYQPCRKLRPHEVNRLRKGRALTKY